MTMRNRARRSAPALLAALLTTLWIAAPAARAAPVDARLQRIDTVETTLENGLRVIVKSDRRAPVAVSQIWYKVGAGYEHDGNTGLSHLLEHMMFKGTRKYGPGVAARLVAENGGRENAFTGQDYTAYYQQLEKSRLEISFMIESDRMRNLLLDEAEFLKERDVVAEERRLRTEDRPVALAREQFLASAYLTSPYRHPVIGWMADIQGTTVADLRDWYDRWYAPNNAVLAVVGDVEPEAVFALARKWFGGIEQRPIRASKRRPELPQRGIREIALNLPAGAPYLMMGYAVPSLKSVGAGAEAWKPYALEVLAWTLNGGPGARLPRRLVREQRVASSVNVGYDPYARLQTLFRFSGTPTGQDAAALRAALQEEVRQLRETPVAVDELRRVKAQVVANAVFERDSLFYQAMQIGRLTAVGLDWRIAERYVERIEAVTAEQIQAAAREYLTDDRLTVATLLPLPPPAATEAQANDQQPRAAARTEGE